MNERAAGLLSTSGRSLVLALLLAPSPVLAQSCTLIAEGHDLALASGSAAGWMGDSGHAGRS